jgi:hypothetical protein
MWQDCLNSEITFWVLLVADVFMIGIVIYGFFLIVKKEREFDKKLAERMEYAKFLKSLKK